MEQKQKTVEEYRQEYANVCSRLGHIEYQIQTLQAEKDLVIGTLKDLNIEASKAAALKSEEKPNV